MQSAGPENGCPTAPIFASDQRRSASQPVEVPAHWISASPDLIHPDLQLLPGFADPDWKMVVPDYFSRINRSLLFSYLLWFRNFEPIDFLLLEYFVEPPAECYLLLHRTDRSYYCSHPEFSDQSCSF